MSFLIPSSLAGRLRNVDVNSRTHRCVELLQFYQIEVFLISKIEIAITVTDKKLH